MSLFLQVVPVSKAIEEIRNLAVRCGDERVPLNEAFHRILAQDVRADVDIPGFTRSVVDGFAVRSADTTGAGDSIPSMLTLLGRVAMGDPGHHRIQPGDCIYVPTGGVLPEGADAVVMIEHTEQVEDQVLIKKPDAIELTLIHTAFISRDKLGGVDVDIELMDIVNVKFLGIAIEEGYKSFTKFKIQMLEFGIDVDKLVNEKDIEINNETNKTLLSLMYSDRV